VFKPAIGLAGDPENYRDIARADAAAVTKLVVQLFHHGIYCVPDGRWYVSGVHAGSEAAYLHENLPKAMRAFARDYHEQVK
jgi:glutamate-1-semialdehyde aminotransferase